jgi:hypothetical protein
VARLSEAVFTPLHRTATGSMCWILVLDCKTRLPRLSRASGIDPATRPPRKECYDPKGDDGLMSTKSSIYKLLRLWNDASAVKKGKVGKRIGRRVAGKTTGRLLRKLFK